MFLTKIGKSIYLKAPIGVSMDPISATQNAIAAFFNFLGTPEGQKVVDDFRALDQAFIKKLKDLFDLIHGKATPAQPTDK